MNPILIDFGFIEVRWYSVLILIAFIIGYLLIVSKCKKNNIDESFVSDLIFYVIIFCIIGARLYYCLFNLEYYSKNILDIFKVWEGGLAIHGGIIAGVLTIFFYSKKKGVPLLKLLDIFAPALVLGQSIGRWGNFFNMEAYGPETTLNILQSLNIPQFIIDGMYIEGAYHHPTFLYESVGCLLIFIIMMIIRNKKKIKEGMVTSIYLISYGIIRFLIEGLRQDSLLLFNLKVAKFVSILLIIIGLYLIIRSYVLQRLKKNS